MLMWTCVDVLDTMWSFWCNCHWHLRGSPKGIWQINHQVLLENFLTIVLVGVSGLQVLLLLINDDDDDDDNSC